MALCKNIVLSMPFLHWHYLQTLFLSMPLLRWHYVQTLCCQCRCFDGITYKLCVVNASASMALRTNILLSMRLILLALHTNIVLSMPLLRWYYLQTLCCQCHCFIGITYKHCVVSAIALMALPTNIVLSMRSFCSHYLQTLCCQCDRFAEITYKHCTVNAIISLA